MEKRNNMSVFIAYDGGGTKTRIQVIDLLGNILYDETTKGCNVMSFGDSWFREIISELYINAKSKLCLEDKDIIEIVLGLSGADLKEDHERLTQLCKPIFNDVKYTIFNDAWIILRSGLKTPYGAVCIAGTGTNSASINKDGKRSILRALNFITGTYGGGLEIATEAIHYAFRASELSYQDTLLRIEIPKLFQVKSMDDVVPFFYPTRSIDRELFGQVTPLVDQLANQGDEVSKMILEKVAYHIAMQTVGVIRQGQMEHETVPVVYGGRVFTLTYKPFMDVFKNTILKEVPNAFFIAPKFHPVVGAYLFALDKYQIKQTKEIEMNLINSGGAI